jgi:hypothetical protein
MQDWPDANSWIANSETLLTDLVRLSDKFDEVMMRGPSTLRTFDMEQVEMNWANFVATARRFSQRLRAAQTVVKFPVDANAIIRVADIVDELNYGTQRWQTSTDEPDREHTTMEFKELYFEPYVRCHHIFVDVISTFREYLSLIETANIELETQREEEVRAKGMKAEELDARCSDDFRSVWWFGRNYSFSTYQSKVVQVLWKAWKNQTPEVSDITLLDASGGDAKQIRDVFKETGNKRNDAWGTMIQRGRKDTLKLVEPEIPKIPT